MSIAAALRAAGRAAKANLLPGLLLQGMMAAFLVLYLWHDKTRRILGTVAAFKQEAGYPFAFFSYVIAAAFLPEVLRIVFFQRGRGRPENLRRFLTAASLWGAMGLTVDLLYRLQNAWFGAGHDFATVVQKMVVDQFLFSPFIGGPVVVAYFYWRDADFRPATLREIASRAFLMERLFPVIVSGWCIWIPGVCLVYFMPPELQLPVAVLIQIFWVLILTTLAEQKSRAVQALA